MFLMCGTKAKGTHLQLDWKLLLLLLRIVLLLRLRLRLGKVGREALGEEALQIEVVEVLYARLLLQQGPKHIG